ncbi:hypothetical protein PAXINDRAFT_158229 [Paxillus involutus ATCC 200175]|uniref:F-box domain-containing protein n=1 Tax=Paxillus involutus ATCC 200175 TaxID=664439 RepID=A0A0C9SYA1_PAXIN|nr:hypothetical protein PAXINDRAFT_158229 [Paxillus involutus ATCC 200175]
MNSTSDSNIANLGPHSQNGVATAVVKEYARVRLQCGTHVCFGDPTGAIKYSTIRSTSTTYSLKTQFRRTDRYECITWQTYHTKLEAKPVHPRYGSAIRAFSNAFAYRTSMEGFQRRHRSKGLAANLPTEVLIDIFKFAYQEHRTLLRSHLQGYNKLPSLKETWIYEEPLSATLFPFAVAAVCPRWCDVLAGVPEYWTRLVILVDEDPTDPITIRSCLQWSGDSPLSVTITRENLDPNQSDEQEPHRSRVPEYWTRLVILVDEDPTDPITIRSCLQWSGDSPLSVTITRENLDPNQSDEQEPHRSRTIHDLLQPHTSRMESLIVSVLHRGSLPDIFTDRGGPVTKLKTLVLSNFLDDNFKAANQRSRKFRGPLDAPSLNELSVSGHCFRDHLLGNSLQMSKIANITSFRLSGHGFIDEHAPGLPLWETLRTLSQLPRMDNLTISDVRFDALAYRERYTGSPISLPRLQTVAFEKLASADLEAIHVIIKGIQLASAIIKECTVDTLSNVNLVGYLTFDAIDVTQDLTVVLDGWSGGVLSLRDSPCVHDWFFQAMSRDLAASPYSYSYLSAPNLSEVIITDCDMFSVSALRDFIYARHRSHGVRRIRNLTVTGRGPAITAEDAEWFRGCLQRFLWNTVQPDGKRYKVNLFSAQVIVT